MLSVVASRYGRALADVVVSSNVDGTQVLKSLRTVEELIDSSAELRGMLESPAVSPAHKRAVMRRLMEPMGLADKVQNFVFVVIDHRRAADFGNIVNAFEHLLDERLGFVAANVRSAVELTGEQRQAIEAQVSRLSGKQVRTKFSTDPALIGGVVARVGSTVYDGSVRGQLDRLKAKLNA